MAHKLYVGQFPQADEKLTRSIEVDASPKNKPEAVDKIDGALGENSPFHHTHGFYVHGVSIETASLPEGWKERTNKVQDYMDENNIGWCIEAHDLAASKLIAYREKDISFVRTLLVEELISAKILEKRIKIIETKKVLKERALNWIARISIEL
ncbi:MAG: DUF6036 family nucleotidyltransferase [Balneolaceae bacterium]